MKKLSHFLVALVICLTSIITLSACGKDKIVSAKVQSGLISRVVLNETLDLSNVVVEAKYESGDKKIFSSSELEFKNADTITSTAGTHELEITISSEEYSFKYSITVVATDADVNAIIQLESNLQKDFLANKALTPSSKDADEMTSYPEGFFDTSEPLYVGDDNPFHFDLVVSGESPSGDLIENIAEVRTNVKVEQWKNGTWTELTGQDLIEMVDINDINAIFNFTDKAVGKKFRLSVAAANPDTAYEEAQYSFTQEVEVIDGFNVYDVDDMSVFDNYNIGWTDAHNRIKEKYSITDADIANVRAVILQKDLELLSPYSETINEVKGVVTDRTLRSINEEDAHKYVRSDAFWNGTEEDFAENQGYTDQVLKGTPYNSSRAGIFRRQIVNGQPFSIIGNYFTINASKMPKMVESYETGVILDDVNKTDDSKPLVIGDGAQYINAFTTLFYTENAEKDYDDVNEMGTHVNDKDTIVTFRNLAFTGNGAMSQDPRNSGALSFMKNREVNFYAYNTTTFNFHTTYTFELGKKTADYNGNDIIEESETYDGDGRYILEKCRAYDSYQTFISLWGAEHTTMIECDFRNAGGPGILADSVKLGTREQSDFDKAYYLDATWSGDALVNPNETYVAGPIVDIVDSTIISKATGEEPWYSSVGAATIVGLLSMYDIFFGGSIEVAEDTWMSLAYMTGYQYDSSKTPEENAQLAEQYVTALGYPTLNRSIIADYATKTNKDNTQTYVPRMDFKAVLGRFQPNEGTMISQTEQLEGSILTFDSEDEYKKHYGIDCVAEKTTNGLELGKVGYVSSMTHAYGLPIFESQKSGNFAGAPLSTEGGVDPNGLRTGAIMAKQILDSTYEGVYSNLPQAPCTIEQFVAMSNDTKLNTLIGILEMILPSPAATVYYDTIYGGIAGFDKMPPLNMLEFCPISNWNELETAQEKCDALKSAFTALVAKGNTSPLEGKYINMYLPKQAGCMGVLIGGYNRVANPNQK